MIFEKRCKCEDDFIPMFLCNLTEWTPIMRPKKELALSAWEGLICKEATFYKKHGYIDVLFDPDTCSYSRKKVMGRPALICRKENRITIRLNNEQIHLLDMYCKRNGIRERAEVIRLAIGKLLKEE